MKISEDVNTSHRKLSLSALQFLDYAQKNPECCRPFEPDTDCVPEILDIYPVQAWPTFVGSQKLQEVRRATVGVTRLLKSIPYRVFQGDPKKINDFYMLEDEHYTEMLFAPPTGLEGGLARCDFIDSPQGMKCLEVNLGAQLGGTEIRFLAQSCLDTPHVARFLSERGVEASYRDPYRVMLRHVIEETLCSEACAGESELNIAIALSHEHNLVSGDLRDCMNELYAEMLGQAYPGVRGKIITVEYPSGLRVDHKNQVVFEGDRIHAVIECLTERTPEHVFGAFKVRAVNLYNGPLAGGAMNNKKALALLSMVEDSDLFNAEERAIIRDHVPWTREVVLGETRYRGESVSFPGFLTAHRQDLVLKIAYGNSGEGVHVGRSTPRDEWDPLIEAAISEGGWIVQEYVESRPYLYQHGEAGNGEAGNGEAGNGEAGYCLHDVVWGTFSFGNTYGGGFLRMIPKGKGAGVINSARGASEGIFYEVP